MTSHTNMIAFSGVWMRPCQVDRMLSRHGMHLEFVFMFRRVCSYIRLLLLYYIILLLFSMSYLLWHHWLSRRTSKMISSNVQNYVWKDMCPWVSRYMCICVSKYQFTTLNVSECALGYSSISACMSEFADLDVSVCVLGCLSMSTWMSQNIYLDGQVCVFWCLCLFTRFLFFQEQQTSSSSSCLKFAAKFLIRSKTMPRMVTATPQWIHRYGELQRDNDTTNLNMCKNIITSYYEFENEIIIILLTSIFFLD